MSKHKSEDAKRKLPEGTTRKLPEGTTSAKKNQDHVLVYVFGVANKIAGVVAVLDLQNVSIKEKSVQISATGVD